MSKNDPALGREIEAMLAERGLATPMKKLEVDFALTKERRIEMIAHHFSRIMRALDLDLDDDSLMDTPNRVAKMYVNEIFTGLGTDNFPKCTQIDNKMNCDEMVVIGDIKVMSACEHHFVTIDGLATVAYIPGERVIGLSKINRIVDYFARRPQVQERLTAQIHATLQHVLKTDDVAVTINAVHYCVKARGVQDQTSHTTTSKLGGVFKTDGTVRAEFLALGRANA